VADNQDDFASQAAQPSIDHPEPGEHRDDRQAHSQVDPTADAHGTGGPRCDARQQNRNVPGD